MFRTGRRRTRLVDIVSSRGDAPASVAARDGRVYVLNSGDAPSVTAFWRRGGGSLTAIGTRALAPGAAGAAQVSVTPGSLTAVGTTLLAPSPRDLDFDASGRYLHAISPGGQVTVYRVSEDGSLTVGDTAPAAAAITGAAAL